MKFNEDPARITKGMDEEDARDDLIAALVDNIIVDPANVHSVLTTTVASSSSCTSSFGNNTLSFGTDVSSFGIEVTFNNTVGQTCNVDSILETLNMRDWRVFCDKFLTKMVKSIGRSADAYNWPTPHPEVTKVPEEDDTDVIASVRVKWSLDEITWLAAKSYVDYRVRCHRYEIGEEMCVNCDTQIKYKVEEGKNVVTCPKCGVLNPICNECTMPEREKNACDRCKIYNLCKKMNKHMAEWSNEK